MGSDMVDKMRLWCAGRQEERGLRDPKWDPKNSGCLAGLSGSEGTRGDSRPVENPCLPAGAPYRQGPWITTHQLCGSPFHFMNAPVVSSDVLSMTSMMPLPLSSGVISALGPPMSVLTWPG